jgi:hypothetical protein
MSAGLAVDVDREMEAATVAKREAATVAKKEAAKVAKKEAAKEFSRWFLAQPEMKDEY